MTPKKLSTGNLIYKIDRLGKVHLPIKEPLKIVTIWNRDLMRRDMYIHEFQNLYFDLAKKDFSLRK